MIVWDAPAVCEPEPVTTNLVAVPGVKVTDAVFVNALESKVALTLAAPTLVPDVNVAVYVPLLLFVVDPTEPKVEDTTTVPPDEVRLFE